MKSAMSRFSKNVLRLSLHGRERACFSFLAVACMSVLFCLTHNRLDKDACGDPSRSYFFSEFLVAYIHMLQTKVRDHGVKLTGAWRGPEDFSAKRLQLVSTADLLGEFVEMTLVAVMDSALRDGPTRTKRSVADAIDLFEDLHAPPGLDERIGQRSAPDPPFLLVGQGEANPNLCELALTICSDERNDLLAPPIYDFFRSGA